jgi:hypothetical protein
MNRFPQHCIEFLRILHCSWSITNVLFQATTLLPKFPANIKVFLIFTHLFIDCSWYLLSKPSSYCFLNSPLCSFPLNIPVLLTIRRNSFLQINKYSSHVRFLRDILWIYFSCLKPKLYGYAVKIYFIGQSTNK